MFMYMADFIEIPANPLIVAEKHLLAPCFNGKKSCTIDERNISSDRHFDTYAAAFLDNSTDVLCIGDK